MCENNKTSQAARSAVFPTEAATGARSAPGRLKAEVGKVLHDIALTAINDGKSYADRCRYARQERDNPLDAYYQHNCALFWLSLSGKTARNNFRRFNDPGDPAPTAIEILTAAIELAHYMLNHVNECDELGEALQEENSHA